MLALNTKSEVAHFIIFQTSTHIGKCLAKIYDTTMNFK